MLCAAPGSPAPVLTSGRQRLFGPPLAPNGNEENHPPMLPPYVIEQLIRPLVSVPGRDREPPPPPQTVVTLSDRSGLLEISNRYDTTYTNGRTALQRIYAALEQARASGNRAEALRLLDGIAGDLTTLQQATSMIRDAHTRHGLSEYGTIENWLNLLYADRRAQRSGADPVSTQSLRLEGLMLGFNLSAINKSDPTYRTGTAVKLLIEREARALASEWGHGARGLGLWGTNTVVAGIPENRAAEFRRTVLQRVAAFLGADQALPPDICDQIGARDLRTSDLAGRDAIVRDPNTIGLTAGHRSILIDPADVRPGQADVRIIEMLESLGECEREASRLGRPLFTGEVPADSPVRGRSGRPVLQTPAVIPNGVAPHDVAPLPTPDPNHPNQTTPTPDEVTSGRLPRPQHDAGHLTSQADRLAALVDAVRLALSGSPTANANAELDAAITFLANPENRPAEAQPRSMLEFFDGTYRMSLEQHRFPGVFRLEMFPQIANRMFGGERFFIQMAEYRDYWGHNRTHAPDAGDSMHRLTMDLLVRGYEYHGIEVLTGTQGGDEVFFAIRGRTADGQQLTDADIARISDYLATNFNRVFQNVQHHEVTKVPMMPGGRFAGRNYLLHEGRLYVERGAYNAEQLTELREVVRTAYGQTIDPANITVVESLSKVGQVERLRLWSRVDSETGRVIEVFRPLGERPEGFTEVRIPLSTTVTSAVEVPANSAPEVVRLAMDIAGQQADAMKREGVDRPRAPGDTSSSAPDPVRRIPLTDRLNATRGGRLFLHGGLFAAGDLISEGALQIFTGRSGLGSFDFYANMARGYALMSMGTYGGETLGRAGVAAFDGRLFIRQGERTVLNEAALRAEYTGLRSAGVHGAGILGAVMLSELVTRGHLDVSEMGWTLGGMGTAMGTTRFVAWGVGAGLESAGVITTAGRTAFMRHPVTAIAIIAAECLIMKGINRLREGWAREESETNLRDRLGRAMRELDYTIARTPVVRADGTTDSAAQQELQAATRRVTEAFGDYMIFRFAHGTAEGRAYIEAQQTLAERENHLQEVLRREPNLADEVRANPAQQETIIRNFISRIEGTWGDSAGRGIGQPSRSRELRNALDQRNEARTVLQNAERSFQSMVRDRLQNANDRSFPVPLHQSAAGFTESLRTEPVEIYQQFQSYLTTRMAYSDQIHAHGTDAAAIEAHYAPAAPAVPMPPPSQIRFLFEPDRGPLDSVFVDPFSLNPRPSGYEFLFANHPLPINANNASVLVAPPVPGDTNNLFGPPPSIATDDAGSSPLFFLAAPGVVRPLRADDSLTAGGVWVFNTETRRYEMMRDLPVLTGTSDQPVLDLSTGRVRPVARPLGSGGILTVDLRGPRPWAR